MSVVTNPLLKKGVSPKFFKDSERIDSYLSGRIDLKIGAGSLSIWLSTWIFFILKFKCLIFLFCSSFTFNLLKLVIYINSIKFK